jgi:hypothetical protein
MDSRKVIKRLNLMFIVTLYILVACNKSQVISEESLRHHINAILADDWKIIEIQKDQYPDQWLRIGTSGQKVMLEGKKRILKYTYHEDAITDVTVNIEKNPRYIIWFMPKSYIEDIKIDQLFSQENQYQGHHNFMHPYLIGVSRDMVIFGTYEEGVNLSEPKELPWDLLSQKILKQFNAHKYDG